MEERRRQLAGESSGSSYYTDSEEEVAPRRDGECLRRARTGTDSSAEAFCPAAAVLPPAACRSFVSAGTYRGRRLRSQSGCIVIGTNDRR